MTTVKPGPSNGSIRLGEVALGSAQLTPPLYPQSDGFHLHYPVLLSTGS